MAKAGLESIELAKQLGTWNALDKVEALELPQKMNELLAINTKAKTHWETFPRSAKRSILEWIYTAKTANTQLARIEKTVNLANQNIKANYPN
jgi:uncharacterized protein YdeI (YjbR/CyaY-like superfamily)